MATAKKMTRTFAYKRADGYTKASLEDLIRLAVKQSPTIGSRKLDVSTYGDGETFHLLNDYHDLPPTYFAGVLCSYSPGRHQQIFPIEDTATTVPLSSLEPKIINQNGKKITQEFPEGSIYFILRGNHVVLSPSMAFRPEKAEHYFNWLLRDRAKLLHAPTVIYLQDQPPPDKLAKIDHVKSLTIGDSISFSSSLQKDRSETKIFDVKPEGHLWEAFRSLIPDLPETVSLTKALTDEVIRASLTLKIGRKGKDAEDFFNQVATATRNQEGLDFTIDMGKHGRLKSNEFKLTHHWPFELVDGKINQLEVFRKMNDWLDGLLKTKRIFRKV